MNKLPYREDYLLDLTLKDQIEWELKIAYAYTLGTMEPYDRTIESATAPWNDFTLRYDGVAMLYFQYHSLELGYIEISQDFRQAIEQNGDRLRERLRARLGQALC
jgi:hypothetical protein